jgi:hypothetical protein
MKQVKNSETVYCLENEQNIFEALKFQTIIVQSGNIELFIKLVSDQSAMKDRVIFIKNVETIKAQISRLLDPYMFVVSGDFELNVAQQDLKNKAYRTKIFLTPISGELIPRLEKYQGFMKSKQGDKIIAVN